VAAPQLGIARATMRKIEVEEALINLGGFETPILQSISQLFIRVETSLLEPI
jgi:hypothetical protein